MLAEAVSTSLKWADVIVGAVFAAVAFLGFKERNFAILSTLFIVAVTATALFFKFGS